MYKAQYHHPYLRCKSIFEAKKISDFCYTSKTPCGPKRENYEHSRIKVFDHNCDNIGKAVGPSRNKINATQETRHGQFFVMRQNSFL